MTNSILPDEEARRRAATELGTTFLVEAGAGTGKTSVLLQRLLTLVRSGRSPLERVAAITFTERAAAELRVRLRSEIETALAGPLSDEERRNLREARSQLEHAQISTVHAFCAALLRERPVEARVDPAFSVLDQFGANLLRNEAWPRSPLWQRSCQPGRTSSCGSACSCVTCRSVAGLGRRRTGSRRRRSTRRGLYSARSAPPTLRPAPPWLTI